jgi:hypothetical protein
MMKLGHPYLVVAAVEVEEVAEEHQQTRQGH